MITSYVRSTSNIFSLIVAKKPRRAVADVIRRIIFSSRKKSRRVKRFLALDPSPPSPSLPNILPSKPKPLYTLCKGIFLVHPGEDHHTMPVATTARAWLASPTPPPTEPPRHPAASDSAQEPSTDGNATSATTRLRREWPQPVPANEQNGCCPTLSCVKKFQAAGESFLARTLSKEQEFIRLCSTREDRKRFVLDRVPVVRLGPGQGSMIAAGIPVCTRFFRSSFGVSNQVIDACKGTPHARASSNPAS